MESRKKGSKDNTFTIFVYGTLRKGYGNHSFINQKDSKFVGNAKSISKYTMTANEYEWEVGMKSAIPFVSEIPHTKIFGEIYEVSEKVLERLDVLEGHPEWYRRKKAKFGMLSKDPKRVTKKMLEAWVYFNETQKGEVDVPSGDYSVQYPLKK